MRDASPRHEDNPLAWAGAPAEQAAAAIVALHGRGANAADILGLAIELSGPGICCVAPQATDSSWYPQAFLAPRADNEPWLSSALDAVASAVAALADAGIGLQSTVVLGFSQGACLALDYAARHPRRYGAVIGLAGGLIGARGEELGGMPEGSFAGTPILLGCGDRDAHIPVWRVEESARLLEERGGAVTTRLYPGWGHGINADELARARALVAAVPGSGESPRRSA